MTRKHFARLVLALLLFDGSAQMLSAQAGEVFLFGGSNGRGAKVFDAKIPSGGTYGFKVGGFFDSNFELDGNLSWYNHFGLSVPDGVEIIYPTDSLDAKVRSLLWEASGTYNFGESTVGLRWTPYVTVGVGGITARLKNVDSVFVTGGGLIPNPLFTGPSSSQPEFVANPARQIVMNNNATFFTFSYGGGIKAMKLWGPAGVRFEIRGRTIPNFYSSSLTRAEYTGGLLFSWGER
jgi:Outer membrane protein beta-barrel domain